MNTKDKGKIGELVLMAEAAKRGYTVCVPYGDNQRYDLILDRGNKLERVQVKCLTPKDGRLELNLYTVMHNKDGSDGTKYRRSYYNKAEVDLICIVNLDTYEVCMIPFSDVSEKSTARFRLSRDSSIRKNNDAKYCEDYMDW